MVKNISWTFLSNVVSAIVKWLMLILIAQWLAPADVGHYALALAITAPLSLFANMKLRALYVNDDAPNYATYRLARNIVSIVAMAAIAVIAALFYADFMMIVVLIGLSKLVELASDLLYAPAHRQLHMMKISKWLIVKQLILLVLFIIVLLVTKQLFITLVSQLLVQILFLFVESYIFVKPYVAAENKNRRRVAGLLALGLPLGLTQLAVSFNSFLPRYVLEMFTDAETLGYFAAISYVTVVANIVMGALSQNYYHVFKHYHQTQQYTQLVRTLHVQLGGIALLLSATAALVSFLGGKYVLTLLYGPSYAQYDYLLLIFCACIFVNALNWNIDTVFTSVGIVKKQFYFVAIASIISIPLTIYCIYKGAMTGAALAMVLNSLVLYSVKAIYFRRWLRKNENKQLFTSEDVRL